MTDHFEIEEGPNIRNPEALTDQVEDAGLLESTDEWVNRRAFLNLAKGVGSAAALSALSGCTGSQDGGQSSPTEEDGESTESGPGDGSQEMDEVRFSMIPVAATIPILTAIEFGFFEDKNIEIDWTRSISGARETAQLATGQLDGTSGAFGASLVNSINEGVPVRVVADYLQHVGTLPSEQRVHVRADEYPDVENVDLDDFAGDTFATTARGSSVTYGIQRSLQAHGLTIDDIEITALSFPDQVPALDSGGIDVACLPDPLGSGAEARGISKHLEYVSTTVPDFEAAVVMFGEPFMQQRPDVARRFLEAYLMGIRKYYELGYWSEEIMNVYSNHLDIPTSALESGLPVWNNRNGRVFVESILDQQEFYVNQGLVEEAADRSDLIKTDLLDEALDTVGGVDQPIPSLNLWESWTQDAPSSLTIPERREIHTFDGLPTHSV